MSQRCLFLHLPKCGGTSLSEALYAAVPLQRRIGVIDALSTRRAAAMLAFDQDDAWICHDDLEHGHEAFALRERLLLTHAAWDTTLIHGHVLFSDVVQRHVAPRYHIVSVMRDPSERAVSNYRMALRAGIAPAQIDDWLESPLGRQHAQTALRYLSGLAAVPTGGEAAALERALGRIERFALIGFLDAMPAFLQRLAGVLGVRIRPGRTNEATGPEVKLNPDQRARLEDLCAPDRAIYDRAREVFG